MPFCLFNKDYFDMVNGYNCEQPLHGFDLFCPDSRAMFLMMHPEVGEDVILGFCSWLYRLESVDTCYWPEFSIKKLGGELTLFVGTPSVAIRNTIKNPEHFKEVFGL